MGSERALGRGHHATGARIHLHRHAQGATKSLEYRLALVMRVVAAQVVDVQGHQRVVGEALKEFMREVDVELADARDLLSGETDADLADTTPEDWERLLTVNVLAVHRQARAARPHVASLLLTLTCLLWRPIGGTVYVVTGPVAVLLEAAQISGVALTLLAVRRISLRELAGLDIPPHAPEAPVRHDGP